MTNNHETNLFTAYKEYCEALERKVKDFSDEQLAYELRAFDKIWEYDEFRESFFFADTEIETILREEAVERFLSKALEIKGE